MTSLTRVAHPQHQSRLFRLDHLLLEIQICSYLKAEEFGPLIETCIRFTRSFPHISIRKRIHFLNNCHLRVTIFNMTIEKIYIEIVKHKDHLSQHLVGFVKARYLDCTQHLLPHVSPEQRGWGLHEAIKQKDDPACTAILASGAISSHFRIVCLMESMVQDNKILFNLFLSMGPYHQLIRTLVVEAAKYGRLQMMKQLIGNEQMTRVNYELALEAATTHGHLAIIIYLNGLMID